MKILSITVIINKGADIVILITDLPSGIWPFTENQFVKMELAKGSSKKYLATHFPDITPTFIDSEGSHGA